MAGWDILHFQKNDSSITYLSSSIIYIHISCDICNIPMFGCLLVFCLVSLWVSYSPSKLVTCSGARPTILEPLIAIIGGFLVNKLFNYIKGDWKDGDSEVNLDPMKKGFLDNNGYYMALGGHYLCFPGNWILSFLHLASASSQVLLFACTAFIINIQDLAIMCESLHFVVVLSSTCIMIINFLLLRPKIEFIMRSLGEGVYDYGDTLDADSLKNIRYISRNAKSAKKLYTRIFVTLVLITMVVIGFVRPIVIHLVQKVDYTNDFKGMNRYLPAPTWYPFDTQDTLVRILCAVNQYITVFTVPCSVFGFDLTFLCISEEIIVQLKTIGITMRNVTVRAHKLMKTCPDIQIGRALTVTLNHSVKHHIVVTRLFVIFNDLYYYTLLMMMTGATFMLCLSCILFTSNEVGYTSKLTFFFFLMAELSHTFLFCWYGEQIKQTSANILNEIYDSDWIHHSKHMKFYVLMIAHRALKPLIVDAGGFMDASMNTFANVLRSAYSYFNVLNATK